MVFTFPLFSDETIKLSRKLSSLDLTHSICNNVIPSFDRRIYKDVEHQNLYVLDMDCDYATEILRQVLSTFRTSREYDARTSTSPSALK